MTRERFERDYNICVVELTFQPHYSGLYEVAEIGPYAVYHNIAEDSYAVTENNSVCRWRHDLSQYLPQK